MAACVSRLGYTLMQGQAGQYRVAFPPLSSSTATQYSPPTTPPPRSPQSTPTTPAPSSQSTLHTRTTTPSTYHSPDFISVSPTPDQSPASSPSQSPPASPSSGQAPTSPPPSSQSPPASPSVAHSASNSSAPAPDPATLIQSFLDFRPSSGYGAPLLTPGGLPGWTTYQMPLAEGHVVFPRTNIGGYAHAVHPDLNPVKEGEGWPCRWPDCQVVSGGYNIALRHVRLCHLSIRYQCTKCHKEFHDVDALRRHYRNLHKELMPARKEK